MLMYFEEKGSLICLQFGKNYCNACVLFFDSTFVFHFSIMSLHTKKPKSVPKKMEMLMPRDIMTSLWLAQIFLFIERY